MGKLNWSPGVGKEISIRQVLKSLTGRRIWNALINSVSFVVSVILRRPVVWGLPPIVNIEPTNICNLKCPLCITGSGQMKRPRGKMDYKDFQIFINTVADRVIYITLYHQGEPYIHPQFNDMVALAKSKNLYVSTSTNGHYFRTREAAEQAIRSGLDSMIISLDGVTQESYEHYRRGGNLQEVLDGIKRLVDAKQKLHSKTPYLFVQFLVMKHNENQINDIKKVAKQLGVDRLLIKTIQVMTFEEAVEWLPENGKYSRYDLSEEDIQVKQGKGACPRLWLTTLIDWDGTIVPCCFDKNADYAMGHFADAETFRNVWISEKYSQFRRQILKDRNAIDICRNCNYGIGLFK